MVKPLLLLSMVLLLYATRFLNFWLVNDKTRNKSLAQKEGHMRPEYLRLGGGLFLPGPISSIIKALVVQSPIIYITLRRYKFSAFMWSATVLLCIRINMSKQKEGVWSLFLLMNLYGQLTGSLVSQAGAERRDQLMPLRTIGRCNPSDPVLKRVSESLYQKPQDQLEKLSVCLGLITWCLCLCLTIYSNCWPKN